jgi:Tfp pilus assembly protein PilV
LAGESGLSLAEVLVALVVFTIGALGLAGVIPLGMNRVTDSNSDTVASTLAAERCEALLATPYDDETLDAGDHTDPGNPYEGHYNVSWTVEVDEPRPECKRVTVRVQRGTGRVLVRLAIVVPHTGV